MIAVLRVDHPDFTVEEDNIVATLDGSTLLYFDEAEFVVLDNVWHRSGRS